MAILNRSALMVAIALIGALSLVASRAGATPRSNSLAAGGMNVLLQSDSLGRLQSDGVRYVAYGTGVLAAIKMHVLDSKSGKTQTVPRGCVPHGMRSTGTVAEILTACQPPEFENYSVTKTSNLSSNHNLSVPSGSTMYSLGRYWAFGTYIDPADPGTVDSIYVNRQSGAVRIVHEPNKASAPFHATRDLDVKLLPKVAPAVSASGVISRETIDGNFGAFVRLKLRRNGKTTTLSGHCHPLCRSVTYGGGIATWVDETTVHAYRVRDQRAAHWKLTGLDAFYSVSVVHTQNRVYAKTDFQSAPDFDSTPTLFVARIRR